MTRPARKAATQAAKKLQESAADEEIVPRGKRVKKNYQETDYEDDQDFEDSNDMNKDSEEEEEKEFLGEEEEEEEEEDHAESSTAALKRRRGKTAINNNSLTLKHASSNAIDKYVNLPNDFTYAELQAYEAQHSPYNWWWEFPHERLPELKLTPEFDSVFVGNKELKFVIPDDMKLPCEVIVDVERKLRVKGPRVNILDEVRDYYYEEVFKTYQHPDPQQRFNPDLVVSDFVSPDDLVEYTKKVAICEKARQLKYKSLSHHEKKLQITKEIVEDKKFRLRAADGKFHEFNHVAHETGVYLEPTYRYIIKEKTDEGAFIVEIFLKASSVRRKVGRYRALDDSEGLINHLLHVAGTDKMKIPDTTDLEEVQTPQGFRLDLRSYQKRTLGWLLEMERNPESRQLSVYDTESELFVAPNGESHRDIIQLGPAGAFWLPVNHEDADKTWLHFDKRPRKPQRIEITCNGAILADDTGTGKTVTALALIHACPFESIDCGLKHAADPLYGYLPSRATLIVCPSHLAEQWRAEAARCLPKTAVILVITTILDFKKLTWNDLLLSDIVIASLSFLQNQSYAKYLKESDLNSESDFSRHIEKLREGGRKSFGQTKKKIILSRIYWHRVICDEFHELGASSNTKQASRFFLNNVESRFFLGITGTPGYSSPEDVCKMAMYLNTKLPNSRESSFAFLNKFVRRNEPNLNLPPLIEKHIWIDLSVQERALYLTLKGTDALLACNHHHLAQGIIDMVSDEKEMSIDEVVDAVQKAREKRIMEMEQRVDRLLKQLQKVQTQFTELTGLTLIQINHQVKKELFESFPDEDEKIRIENLLKQDVDLRATIQSLNHTITEIRSQYTFFQKVLDSLEQKEERSCIVCMDDITEYSIARCGHVYCASCADTLMKRADCTCPMCRVPLKQKDMMRVKLTDPNNENGTDDQPDETVEETTGHLSKYGSKLAAFVTFMRKTLRETPDAKFVLFIQFRRLMALVSKALKEFDIEHVQCTGNVMGKSRAVRLFKESENVRLILLSSEDSVSGLHLTNATHMIIFHPFQGEHKTAMAYEKQGIARAWRSGLDHPVHLIRFITNDSVEETLASERNYQEGVRQSC